MENMREYELQLLRHSCGLPLGEAVDAPTDSDLSRATNLIIRGRYLDALQTVSSLKALLDCSSAGSDAAAVQDAESYYSLVSKRAASILATAASSPSVVQPTQAATTATAAAHAISTEEGAAASVVPPSLDPGAVLLAGVASLHVFVQYNLTGPSYDAPPPSPLDLFAPPHIAQHLSQPPPPPTPA
ncbi:hypothetical protein Agub_g15642, partial [Astrephomene gubernaculifera]